MSDRCKMRRRIAAFDFMIWELGIYLDTHAQDKRAMQTRNEYMQKRKALVQEYEKCFGPYVVTADDIDGDQWTWIDNPWPWDYQKEGC